MTYNFKDTVRTFMVFDILGDTLRSGPVIWAVNRSRIEDVKNHVLDLILMYRLLERYLPSDLNGLRIIDYMLIHDLPEAITGDITKFEGVTEEEKTKVNNMAIDFLIRTYNDVLDFKDLFFSYEEGRDIEAKIVSMLDAVSSSTTFLKYQCEGRIDLNSDKIIPTLKPYVDLARKENCDVGDIFYNYHRKRIAFTDEEIARYRISKDEADYITEVIKSFLDEFYSQKLDGSLIKANAKFPTSATIYKRV